MAETLTQNQPGTGIKAPSPRNRATTKDEAVKYESMIGAKFSRKDKSDVEEFYYSPISSHPKMITGEPGKFIMQFSIQKYHRNKFVKTTRDGKPYSLPMAVSSSDREGNFDAWASFFIDCDKFCDTFAAE